MAGQRRRAKIAQLEEKAKGHVSPASLESQDGGIRLDLSTDASPSSESRSEESGVVEEVLRDAPISGIPTVDFNQDPMNFHLLEDFGKHFPLIHFSTRNPYRPFSRSARE